MFRVLSSLGKENAKVEFLWDEDFQILVRELDLDGKAEEDLIMRIATTDMIEDQDTFSDTCATRISLVTSGSCC